MFTYAAIQPFLAAISVLQVIEWLAALSGIAGSWLLAVNGRRAGWGFLLFLISNGFWLYYGSATGACGLVTQQIFFTASSLFGIYRWLIAPQQRPPRSESGRQAV